MSTISGRDVFCAKNQPYGYWRAGNPIVKFAPLLMMLIGAYWGNTALIVQCAVVIFILLKIPLSERSWFLNVIVNLGGGSLLVTIVGPEVIPYTQLSASLRMTVRGIGVFDGMRIGSFVAMMFALLGMTRAVTARDYAWLVDLVPFDRCREWCAGWVFSVPYGLLRFPQLLFDGDVCLRSRGVPRPYSIHVWCRIDRLVDCLSLWWRYFERQMDEMMLTIDYAIVSRVRLGPRKTPVARVWSSTDFSVAGILVFAVLLPRWQPYLPKLSRALEHLLVAGVS